MRTLILGLGNPILTDDGVGVWIAEAVGTSLAAAGSPPPPDTAGRAPALLDTLSTTANDVDVQEVSVGGLTLMETMIGYDRVILVDAFDGPGSAPGSVQRMTLADLRGHSATQHSASPHDASLITALDMGQRMGLALPTQIIIYAIGVENVVDFGDQPTPAVAAAIPRVAQAVLAEIEREEPDGIA